jgi:hypothetical protein
MAGFCEYGNESSGCMRCCQLVKNTAARSQLVRERAVGGAVSSLCCHTSTGGT